MITPLISAVIETVVSPAWLCCSRKGCRRAAMLANRSGRRLAGFSGGDLRRRWQGIDEGALLKSAFKGALAPL